MLTSKEKRTKEQKEAKKPEHLLTVEEAKKMGYFDARKADPMPPENNYKNRATPDTSVKQGARTPIDMWRKKDTQQKNDSTRSTQGPFIKIKKMVK
jgi:hypothetical protein